MPAAPATPKRPIPAPQSPIARLISRRRAREAAAERGVFGAAILLALTASGFAGYTLSQPARPYDVRAVLPATAGPFAWKRTITQGEPPVPDRAPEAELDPLVTGSLPEAPAAPSPAPAGALPERTAPPPGGFALRRASAGLAVVEDRSGLHQVGVGSILPGAGRVLSIRSTGAGWIVITTETIIGPTPL